MFVATLLVLFALSQVAVAENCFEFTGALAEEDFEAPLGSTLEVTWKTLTTGKCSTLTAKTQILVELWDDDLFFDDKLVVLSADEAGDAIANSGVFRWSVPFDTTELNTLAGSGGFLNIGGSTKLYFKIVVQANTDLNSESKRFTIHERGASVAIDSLDSKSYATGSSLQYTVRTYKLPEREIECFLTREPSVLMSLLNTPFKDNLVRYPIGTFKTENNGELQEHTFEVKITSNLENSDTYNFHCETADDKTPKASYYGARTENFKIEKSDHELTIVSPTSETTVDANTVLEVSWTSGKGLAATELLRADLVEKSRFGSFFDSVVASVGQDEAVAPSVGQLSLHIPPGAVGKHEIELYVEKNRAIRVVSGIFNINEAKKGCVLVSPAAMAAVPAGEEVTMSYKCVGFTDEAIAKAELINENRYRSGGAQVMRYEVAASTSLKTGEDHSLTYDVSDALQPGWAWHLSLTPTGESSMVSRPVLIVNTGDEHCARVGSTDRVACTPQNAREYVAVTTGHELEISEISFNFDGVVCKSKYANFEVDSKIRLRGQTKSATTKLNLYEGQPLYGTPLLGGNLGDSVADSFLLLVSEVSYPLDRTSISFKVQLSQAPDLGVLDIGVVTLMLTGLPDQCDTAVDSDLEANQRTIAAYTPPPEVMIGEGGMGEIGAEQTTGGDVTGQGSGPAQDADAASSVALASAALLIALASLI